MRRPSTTFLTLILLVAAAASPARAQQEADDEPITTELWRQRTADDDALWDLLRLPERWVQLAFAPLNLLVSAANEYRIDNRLHDLFTNDEGTAFWGPQARYSGHDGIGVGAAFIHLNLFDARERLRASALVREDEDFKLSGKYDQRVARLNGRKAWLASSYEEDRNERYYGVGGATKPGDERVLGVEQLILRAGVELVGASYSTVNADFEAAYRRESLTAGTDASVPSVAAGDSVRPPAGFGRTLDIGELMARFGIDTRDGLGSTTRGLLLEVDAVLMHDFNGAGYRAVRGALHSTIFVPVLPRKRALVVSVGAAVVAPLVRGDRVPLRGLVSLGRTNHLRGFVSDRFHARKAWWGGAEYRYPVFEFRETGITASSTLFVDVARAGRNLGDLVAQAPLVAGGFGVRFDAPLFSVLRLQVGFSREGSQFTIAAGDAP